MMLTGYSKTILRPACNPSFRSVHCIAHLYEDVSKVLPYLNAVLGGTQYLESPPEVVLNHYGKIIKVGGRQIAINALKDEQEADRILEWLKNEINLAWENRDFITPCREGKLKPKLIEILKLLPRTNCGKCGQSTCMVFAVMAQKGVKTADDCPELSEENRARLAAYLDGFDYE